MFAHKADAYAEQGNVKGIERCAVAYPLALGFLLRFPIVFAAIYLGADVVEKLLDVIPEWLTHGLSVTGSTLPALGFAITICHYWQKYLSSIFYYWIFCGSVFGN